LRTKIGDNAVGKPGAGPQALDSKENIDIAQSLGRWTSWGGRGAFHNWRVQACGQAQDDPAKRLIFRANFPLRKIQAAGLARGYPRKVCITL
jgi:hypothetical protein